jgi:Putative transposase
VIAGGGISPDRKRWIHPRYALFLPVKALSKVFRGKFVAGLRRALQKKLLTCTGSIQHLDKPKCFASFLRTLFRQDWVVYAKRAFGGPEQVIRYLGRYTHRVAISNHRLIAFDSDDVTFRWQGLRWRQQDENDDGHRRRVHSALPASRLAEGIRPHPSLRRHGQLPTIRIDRFVPKVARNDTAGPFNRQAQRQRHPACAPLAGTL